MERIAEDREFTVKSLCDLLNKLIDSGKGEYPVIVDDTVYEEKCFSVNEEYGNIIFQLK